MKKITASLLLSSFILFVFVANVKAATTGIVSATVTVQNVSVSVSDGIIAYGTLSTNDTSDTTSTGVNDSQTTTNNGNVAEDFNIQGSDSANWTLGATVDSDQYFHKFCTTDCDGSPVWTALTSIYQTLSSSVAASGTQEFDLQIGTPSSSSNYTQQSVDVTVQAVAS